MRYKLLALTLCSLWVVSAYAQFGVPPRNPYLGSLPSLINVGDEPQVKTGASATLGTITGSISDSLLIADMSSMGRPAFVSDSALLIRQSASPAVDPDWIPVVDVFALDTNAPISVNGVWSKSSVTTADTVSSSKMSYQDIINIDAAGEQSMLCSSNTSGSLRACDNQIDSVISFSAQPNTVDSLNPRSVMLTWSASEAVECHAISGKGFYTDRQRAGSDESNIIVGSPGSSVRFTIACADALGTFEFKSLDISVQ